MSQKVLKKERVLPNEQRKPVGGGSVQACEQNRVAEGRTEWIEQWEQEVFRRKKAGAERGRHCKIRSEKSEKRAV